MLALQPIRSSLDALSRLKWLRLDLGRPRAASLFPWAVLEKGSFTLAGSVRNVDLKGARLLGRLEMGHEA